MLEKIYRLISANASETSLISQCYLACHMLIRF